VRTIVYACMCARLHVGSILTLELQVAINSHHRLIVY